MILFCFCTPCNAHKLKFSCINGLVEQKIGCYVLPYVYKRIGMDIEILPMPGKRAQRSVETGLVHGEVMRIYSYGGEVPGVIRVEPAYFYLDTTPYVRKGSGIKINSVDELRKYKVAKVRGVKHTANITAGMESVYDLDSPEQVIKYLEYGRADVALANSLNWKYLLAKTGCDNIVPAGPSLRRLPLYHYVSIRHSGLADKVGKMFTTMKENGELDELILKAKKDIFD